MNEPSKADVAAAEGCARAADSVIEAMIDQACGCAPPARREPTPEQKEAAKDVARKVLAHIDEMYPRMWDGVAKTARVSVRNTIIVEVARTLASSQNKRSKTPMT